MAATVTANYSNGGGGGGGGGGGEVVERGVVEERHSMMEQLVPEIRTHALSYLDYRSLCRLSMTNSVMRKAANDDNAWKVLFHKDFTLEQDSVTPVNGWKAYYAATRDILNINAEFFNIIREQQLPAMGLLWFNADFVKCIHASGEKYSGYNAVMESWQQAFNWEPSVDFQIRDVRARARKHGQRHRRKIMSTAIFFSLTLPPQEKFHHHSISSRRSSHKSITLRCSSAPSSSPSSVEESVSNSESDPVFPLSGCKACGKQEIESGCNGEGRIQGGIATVPGFGWWPIKAYRPCPGFVASGGRYTRQGQSMDEVAGFGRVEKAVEKVAEKAASVGGNTDEPPPR